jgi:hypothetical protein
MTGTSQSIHKSKYCILPHNMYNYLIPKGKEGDITLPEYKIYCKVVIIKIEWYYHKKQAYRSVEKKKEPMNKYLPVLN